MVLDRTLDIRDGAVRFRVLSGGRGPHLVYFHSFHERGGWSPFLDHLAARYTVLAPFHPGVQGSSGVETLDDVLDLVLAYDELLDRLGIGAAHLVGHFFGGMVAAELAATLRPRAAKLVLISPLGLWRDDAPSEDLLILPHEDLPPVLFRDPASEVARGWATPPPRRWSRSFSAHEQRGLPRGDRDRPPGELHANPRHGRAGDARDRRRRGGGARDHARRPPRDAPGSRGRRLLPRGRGGRLRHRTDARHRRRMDRAMIKRFHALYVGQIELENIGSKGTPADARRYGNERLSEVFFAARDVAQLMDELGYYALWTAEHHFQREGYECFPNLIQLSLWLATQTRRLRLGCAFNVLPMWHPIRLAQDYAMADLVTDGRVITGLGRGYHSRAVH